MRRIGQVGQSFVGIETIHVIGEASRGFVSAQLSKIIIERTVLLQHENDVLELVDAAAIAYLHGDLGGGRVSAGIRSGRGVGGGGSGGDRD